MRTIVLITPSTLEQYFWNLVRIRNPICCPSGIAQRTRYEQRETVLVQRTHLIA